MASLIVEPEADVLTEIHSSPVDPSDLQEIMGRNLSEQEVELLNDFETSWQRFIRSKRGKLPTGRREMNLKFLQEKAKELTTTRDNVEAELNKQLAFFQNSQSAAEDELRAKIEHETKEHQITEKKLQEQLEAIQDAQELQEKTLPWSFFLSCLDAEAAEKLDEADQTKSRTVKPSKRAMHLTYQTATQEPQDMLRRAYQIDHVILKTQLVMLNKQIQCYEKTIASQELANVFLMENNVWSILE